MKTTYKLFTGLFLMVASLAAPAAQAGALTVLNSEKGLEVVKVLMSDSALSPRFNKFLGKLGIDGIENLKGLDDAPVVLAKLRTRLGERMTAKLKKEADSIVSLGRAALESNTSKVMSSGKGVVAANDNFVGAQPTVEKHNYAVIENLEAAAKEGLLPRETVREVESGLRQAEKAPAQDAADAAAVFGTGSFTACQKAIAKKSDAMGSAELTNLVNVQLAGIKAELQGLSDKKVFKAEAAVLKSGTGVTQKAANDNLCILVENCQFIGGAAQRVCAAR